MAWSEPITWTADQVVTAAQMNSEVRDKMNLLKVPIDNDGKIIAISATYFASLDGTAITGVAKLSGSSPNVYTNVQNFQGTGGRLLIPVGADKYAV
jgi:hypothetical protein